MGKEGRRQQNPEIVLKGLWHPHFLLIPGSGETGSKGDEE